MFWLPLGLISVVSALNTRQSDPCAKIAGQKWSATQDVRACFQHFPLNETIKDNILQVIEKSMGFHTSTNYQIQAPAPYEDTKTDILAELTRIRNKQYTTDFEFHVELARTVRQLNDGHGVYVNMCYDSTWTSYLPIPLVLLEGANKKEALYIAPEAYIVASSEFPDQLDVWRSALPAGVSLESLSGAKVISINNRDPFAAMDAAASVAGSYQALSARQNGFTASYSMRGESTWVYIMGSFAQTPLPVTDSVTLSVQRQNYTTPVTITLPYRSRFGKDSFAFTDASSFWANNCLAKPGTNGINRYNSASAEISPSSETTRRFRSVSKTSGSQPLPLMNELLDVSSASDIPMPAAIRPPVGTGTASNGAVKFQMLPDGKTGLIALGSFAYGFDLSFYVGFMNGLSVLYYGGATRIIIDLSNNSGGLLCAAAYLHRLLAGKRSTTEPQALLPTTLRAGPLTRKIVQKISQGSDPNKLLRYNPSQFKYANHTAFPDGYDYLAKPVAKTVNGRSDAFSQTFGQECQPWYYLKPDEQAYLNMSEIVILTNRRCASSCALFAIAMEKLEGVRVVSVGGRKSVRQDYGGTVGGQSLSFADIDSEIKSVGLKSDPAAPPDFITNSYQGITYRLAYGVDNPAEPEEWQPRDPTLRIPLTADNVNQPWKIYQEVAARVFT